LSSSPGSTGPGVPPVPGSARMLRWAGRVPLILVAAFAVYVILTSFFIVPTDSEAILETMGGRRVDVVGPGLHFKIPVIQRAYIYPSLRAQRTEIGYRTVRSGEPNRPAEYADRPEEALMLTGDENIVWAEAAVQWRISDVLLFHKNVEDPEGTVRKAAEAVLRKAVGKRNLDAVLTVDRTQMGLEIHQEMQQLLDLYRTGITVISVQMQNIEPPDEVAGDFKAVVDARETRQRTINEAQRYANQRLPAAQAEAQKMIQEAEAYRVRRIEEARGQVARYTALLEEYQRAPEVTRKRLYLEMLAEVLPKLREVIIVEDDGNVLQHFPLRGASE